MNSEAISWMLKYLTSSEAYIRYHAAMVSGDMKEIDRLLKIFPRLESLYLDFGDIISERIAYNKYKFTEWCNARVALFRSPGVVTYLEPGAPIALEKSEVLVKIRLINDEKEFYKLLKQAGQMLLHSKVRAAMHFPEYLSTQVPPKYSIYSKKSDLAEERTPTALSVATIGSLKKALYVEMVRKQLPDFTGSAPSFSTLLYAIKCHKNNPFGWSASAVEDEDFNHGRYASTCLDSSELTQVKRHLRHYKAYTKNLLEGRFPDHS